MTSQIRASYPKYIKNLYIHTHHTQNAKFPKGEEYYKAFSKGDIKMQNWYMKMFLTLLIIIAMQIKAAVQFHLRLGRMAIKNNKRE